MAGLSAFLTCGRGRAPPLRPSARSPDARAGLPSPLREDSQWGRPLTQRPSPLTGDATAGALSWATPWAFCKQQNWGLVSVPLTPNQALRVGTAETRVREGPDIGISAQQHPSTFPAASKLALVNRCIRSKLSSNYKCKPILDPYPETARRGGWDDGWGVPVCFCSLLLVPGGGRAAMRFL